MDNPYGDRNTRSQGRSGALSALRDDQGTPDIIEEIRRLVVSSALHTTRASVASETHHQRQLQPPAYTQNPIIETQHPSLVTDVKIQQPPVVPKKPVHQITNGYPNQPQPPAHAQSPIIKTQRPSVTPIVNTQQSSVVPVVETQHPPVKTQEPPVMTQQPPIKMQQPPSKTQQPRDVPIEIAPHNTNGHPIPNHEIRPQGQSTAAPKDNTHPRPKDLATNPQTPPANKPHAKPDRSSKPSPSRKPPKTHQIRPRTPTAAEEKEKIRARKDAEMREQNQKQSEKELEHQAARIEKETKQWIEKNYARIDPHELSWPRTIRLTKSWMPSILKIRGTAESKGSKLEKRAAIVKNKLKIHANKRNCSPLLLIADMFTNWAKIRPIISAPGFPVDFTLPDKYGTFGFQAVFPKPDGSGTEEMHFCWRPCLQAETETLGLPWDWGRSFWKLVCEPSQSEIRLGRLEYVLAVMGGDTKTGAMMRFHWGFEEDYQVSLLAVASGLCLMEWQDGLRQWLHWQRHWQRSEEKVVYNQEYAVSRRHTSVAFHQRKRVHNSRNEVYPRRNAISAPGSLVSSLVKMTFDSDLGNTIYDRRDAVHCPDGEVYDPLNRVLYRWIEHRKGITASRDPQKGEVKF
ncbi:hypothetical protein QBC34DRAFT_380558 [Podospora aff. communis PSN243]|uniref:Uncharacterized protein n=1 Tax=Podospora aff. communis PSN243 TaxID=3040156 RepID=A0AAV9GNJ4_9PEZI|nr:hypothetical protein QBC34DRAFT_380558 [Podospora aff. communis PSN243]